MSFFSSAIIIFFSEIVVFFAFCIIQLLTSLLFVAKLVNDVAITAQRIEYIALYLHYQVYLA